MQSAPIPLNQLVENLRMGPAQLKVLALGPFGIFFNFGIHMGLVNVVTTATASSFGLHPDEAALLAVLAAAGLMMGIFTGGALSDSFGRRSMTLLGFAVMGICSTADAFASSFEQLMLGRLLLGVGMGLGMNASLVRLSEVTPQGWRIFMRAGSVLGFALGKTAVFALAGADDPELVHLHWRRLLQLVAPIQAAWFIAAWLLLTESPVWLASIGRDEEAMALFRDMHLANGVPEEPVHYHVSSCSKIAFREALSVAFCRRFRTATLTGLFAALCVNLLLYGDMYASPRIFPEISKMSAAAQLLLKQACDIAFVFISCLLCDRLSRKCSMILCCFCSTICCFSLVVGGSHQPPRPWICESLFELGSNLVPLACSLGYISIFQYALEIYPTRVAGTCSAIIIGSGRIGAVAAPVLFEDLWRVTGFWGSFYVLTGSLSLIAAVCLLLAPNMSPYRPGQPGEEYEISPEGSEKGAKSV